jgi:hypothetical protein
MLINITNNNPDFRNSDSISGSDRGSGISPYFQDLKLMIKTLHLWPQKSGKTKFFGNNIRQNS